MLEKVAEQIIDFNVTLTESLQEAVKIAFLDTVNALVVGMHEPELKRLNGVIHELGEAGTTEVLGHIARFSLMDAAFLTGAASVAVELDEGNQWSKGHPAVHVFPMLLLNAQKAQAYDGIQFMKDFVKSYEIATYFGQITTLKPSLHAHGTWGVLGSAAALGVYYQIGTAKMAKLLNTAATFATPTQWDAAIEGAVIRNIYMSESLVGGFRAWQLTNAGIEAPKNNAVAVFSDILGTQFTLEQPFGQEEYAIQLNYYKFHAFCRYVHVPIEVFQYLFEQHALTTKQIERVEVFTYARASTLMNKQPTNTLGAKFSIPFAIAAWAYTGRTDHGVFSETFIQDERIQRLANKIDVIHEPACDENYPNVMPAIVRITRTDGTILEHEQDAAQGGPSEKANFEQIALKFSENTENILTKSCQNAVIHFVRNLEQQENVTDVIRLINKGLKEELG